MLLLLSLWGLTPLGEGAPLSAPPAADEPGPASIAQVVHVSVDGLRGDLLAALLEREPERFPAFARLLREGASTFDARTVVAHTNTLPNHASMLTGRAVSMGPGAPLERTHGWTPNGDPAPGQSLHAVPPRTDYVASVFDVVHDHGGRTGMFASKTKFSLFATSWGAELGAPDRMGEDHGRAKIDELELRFLILPLGASAQPALRAFLEAQEREPFAYAFLHWLDPDAAGHFVGWESAAWEAAVERVDGYLGELFAALDGDARLAGRTALLLTADHGGRGRTHSPHDVLEHACVPFFVWGPGISAGADLYALNAGRRLAPGSGLPGWDARPQPVRNAEAANLALQLLGLPPVPGSLANRAQDLALVQPALPHASVTHER